MARASRANSASSDDTRGPFIFEALEEQLGLICKPANDKSEVPDR